MHDYKNQRPPLIPYQLFRERCAFAMNRQLDNHHPALRRRGSSPIVSMELIRARFVRPVRTAHVASIIVGRDQQRRFALDAALAVQQLPWWYCRSDRHAPDGELAASKTALTYPVLMEGAVWRQAIGRFQAAVTEVGKRWQNPPAPTGAFLLDVLPDSTGLTAKVFYKLRACFSTYGGGR